MAHPAHGLSSSLAAQGAVAATVSGFKLRLCPNRMLELVKQTMLPEHEEYDGLGASRGIDLKALKELQAEWNTDFDWSAEQESLDKYEQYTAVIEGLTIHFVHRRSSDPNAIPLILSHGWPGSFAEFLPVIDPLANGDQESSVSFHVVVPSLPGFVFSSAPPANWTLDDTARVFDTLMTEVLGYKTYAAHGTDWGAHIAYSMFDNFSASVRAVHLTSIPFLPVAPAQYPDYGIELDENEKFQQQLMGQWMATGLGYYTEQSTKPNTIGLALYDNPIGQLAWMGEKYIEWSDPSAGTGPSVLTHKEILRQVSLYYLSKSFVSSVFTYAHNAAASKASYTKARNDAPMLYSSFKYNGGFWPKEIIALVGNLVSHTYIFDPNDAADHDFGGHFAALDNPPALIGDIRKIGDYWVKKE
ncbi:alpha/beta-hydrolase [Apiospora rasikravindrae]|uniref:Alpha/beta-hydrolase n=1 Tax=Apiospora rasikravindrae TaxID=990691 RepID=A0ABR1TY48_9PEZI